MLYLSYKIKIEGNIMKICYLADLNLPNNKNSIQYDAFHWALEYIVKKKTESIILIGNIATKDAMSYLIEKLNELNIPYAFETENQNNIKPLDPDMAKRDYPSITFFDTEKNEYKNIYYFCPVPTDIHNYLTLSDEFDSYTELNSKTPLSLILEENKDAAAYGSVPYL